MESYVLLNGRVHTRVPQAKTKEPCVVEAMLVTSERIVMTGSEGEVLREAPQDALKIDLKGLSVYPGFHDSHIHFLGYAMSLKRVNLHGVKTIEEGLDLVKEQASKADPGSWIRGSGWDKSLWGRFPTRWELDSVTGSIPTVLTSKDGHSVWVNSKALSICSIDRDTVPPSGGAILKDSDGEPIGILQERAQNLVYRAVPEESPEEKFSAYCDAVPRLWEMGITCVHVPDGLEMFSIAKRIVEEKGLPLRFSVMPPVTSLPLLKSFGIRQGFGDDWVWMGQVKMFKDGSLGSSTALLFEPYEHIQGYYGLEVMPQDVLIENVRKCVDAGYGVAVHAIGDRAVYGTLDAIGSSMTESRRKGLRHRIEHAQMVLDEDIPRFSEMDVIASVQPAHVVADRYMAEREWGKRSFRAYPFGRLKRAGTRLAFGSDAPVETPNVLFGVHCAVNRNLPAEGPHEEWHPAEKLSVDEAIRAYTEDAAYAAGKDHALGRLLPGMYADFVVLSHDLAQAPSSHLTETRVLAVAVGGRFVFADGKGVRSGGFEFPESLS